MMARRRRDSRQKRLRKARHRAMCRFMAWRVKWWELVCSVVWE